MVIRFAVLAIVATLVSGCGQQLEEWVRVIRPKNDSIIPFEGQSAIKVSPGNTVSAAGDVSMRAHVTITDRPLSGGDVSGRISVNRQRGSANQ